MSVNRAPMPATGATIADAPTKKFEMELTIDAPPAAVWQAIADGKELCRWFPIDARVKPGVGGSVFLSWGPACEGESPITIWEPGRRLCWEETHEGGAVTIAVDFFIDARGGETVVRLVQSGFGRGAKWDDMYDSIANGWKFELRSLRHYLKRHKGSDRAAVWSPVKSNLRAEEAFDRLAAPGALVQGSSLAGLSEGDAYRFTGPDGRTYSGKVLCSVPRRSFAGVVSELDDAILRIEVERSGAGSSPFVWLAVWGPKRDLVPAIAEQWRAAIERLVRA